MKVSTNLLLLVLMTCVVFATTACGKDEISPEEVVTAFLEAASYADIDTMNGLSVGKMKDEILRDEQAITKLVYFEREESLEAGSEIKDSKIVDDNTKKVSRFNFDFVIMNEQTKINAEERAQVWVILTRKNVSITRSYDLVWANGIWLIENYTNQLGE